MELSIYVDGTPTDWLSNDLTTKAHTVALVCAPDANNLSDLIDCYSKQQKNGIKQWKSLARGGNSRREHAFNAFFSCISKDKVWLNVAVYREDELRNSLKFLCSEYGERGIGFSLIENEKYKHEFVDFNGYHLIEDKIIKILPMLFLGWLINGMVVFYRNAIENDFPGSSRISINVFLNYLSGDNDSRNSGEKLFQQFLNYDGYQVELTSLKDSPELIFADNAAGIFSECLSNLLWQKKLATVPDRSCFTWKEFKIVDGELLGHKVEF